jgi:propanol-preferring alcohol dehydrogenase
MVFEAPGRPLVLRDLPPPRPRPGEVLLEVRACGLCRTDLHVADGELPHPKLPLVPGHQIVGTVRETSGDAAGLRPGQRVGVPWLGGTCGECAYCRGGEENLCPTAKFTGYERDGGYAEYATAEARFCFPIPDGYPDLQAAPLLCAGLIGYRALGMAGAARTLGFFGFGSAAHILTQVARHQGREVYAFTRKDDLDAQSFARALGASWAGAVEDEPPSPLDAALLFAPVGEHVPRALALVRPGGTVVCAGIHMSDIPGFPYRLLWGERVLRSVANLTREDGHAFLALAPKVPVRTEVEVFPLEAANEALLALRSGRIRGSAVLAVAPSEGSNRRLPRGPG